MKRRYALLMLFILCSLSCRKAGKASCSGSFIAYTVLTGGGSSGLTFELSGMDATTGNQVIGDVGGLEVSYPDYKGVYNMAENSYYVFAAPYYTTSVYLYRINFSGTGDAQFNHTPDSAYTFFLLCNSKSGKLYNITGGWGPNEKVYEVVTTPAFKETKIFTTDSGTIHSPVVDENSGYIFFVSWPNLKKLDPASGTVSIVTTYTNVLPDQLQYDNNDGMFYGVNIYTQPYSFIRINPKNGAVTTLADMSYITGNLQHTFDYCDNLYIVAGDTGGAGWNIGWIDPSTGQLKRKTYVVADWGLTYINHVFN